jgi:hypothetical protein
VQPLLPGQRPAGAPGVDPSHAKLHWKLPPLPAIYPDSMAPVVRQGEDGERKLTLMRWGMPGPEQYGGHPVINIRNTRSPHWRRWLGPAHRCLVPVTSFSESEETRLKKMPVWFALSEARPPFAFACIWSNWTGTAAPVEPSRRRARALRLPDLRPERDGGRHPPHVLVSHGLGSGPVLRRTRPEARSQRGRNRPLMQAELQTAIWVWVFK